jgi:hypothetical protein
VSPASPHRYGGRVFSSVRLSPMATTGPERSADSDGGRARLPNLRLNTDTIQRDGIQAESVVRATSPHSRTEHKRSGSSARRGVTDTDESRLLAMSRNARNNCSRPSPSFSLLATAETTATFARPCREVLRPVRRGIRDERSPGHPHPHPSAEGQRLRRVEREDRPLGMPDHVLDYERRHLDRVLRASVTITRTSGRTWSWTWLPEPACTRLRQGVREGRRLRERTCSGV